MLLFQISHLLSSQQLRLRLIFEVAICFGGTRRALIEWHTLLQSIMLLLDEWAVIARQVETD